MNFYKTNDDWHNGDGTKLAAACIQTSSRDNNVPRVVAEEAYKEYSFRYGTGQSLDRLCERGGFGASELALLLYGRIARIESERTQAEAKLNDALVEIELLRAENKGLRVTKLWIEDDK